MTTKRVNLLAGTILGGALLLGTAGLVLAQDPTPGPSPSVDWRTPGNMMGGQGMMGGPGMIGGQGMMAGMDRGDMRDMGAMHQAMGQGGSCDPTLMQTMHEQQNPTR